MLWSFSLYRQWSRLASRARNSKRAVNRGEANAAAISSQNKRRSVADRMPTDGPEMAACKGGSNLLIAPVFYPLEDIARPDGLLPPNLRRLEMFVPNFPEAQRGAK